METMRRGVTKVTAPIFFDTDCLSNFLWIGREDILLKLYEGRIYVPEAVYEELSNPGVSHLAWRIDQLNWEDRLEIECIYRKTPEFDLYYSLAINPPENQKLIGRGEASAIALAKFHDGIVASNDHDVEVYINKYALGRLTTGSILAEALTISYITESEGNQIWAMMKRKRARFPEATFTDYLRNYP